MQAEIGQKLKKAFGTQRFSSIDIGLDKLQYQVDNVINKFQILVNQIAKSQALHVQRVKNFNIQSTKGLTQVLGKTQNK